MSDSSRRTLLSALVLVGVALRLWAYLADPSLWLDEILLSRGIVHQSLGQLLTQPLPLDQVAPRGFLALEKMAVVSLGDTELALRLVPLLFGIAGMILFRRLAERMLEGWAAPLAVFLVAFAIPFLRYSAEVKQYGIDATVTTLLTLLALSLQQPDQPARRLVLLGLVAFIVIWFSQTSVIVMAGIGFALGVEWLISRDRAAARALLITVPLWTVASLAALAAGFQSMTPSTREFMSDFWRQGFLPLPFQWVVAVQWIWAQALSVFSDPTLLRYPWPTGYLILAGIGVVALWRVRRSDALLMLGPLCLALAAAAAQQYPFRGRLIVYLMPSLLLAIAAGVEGVRRQANRLHPALGTALFAAVSVGPLLSFAEAQPPYELESHRQVFGYLQSHRRPGDVVYLFPLSRVGGLYYGPRFGLSPSEWVTGICDRNETRSYLHDVDRYRGAARVWVLTSGARPYRVARAAVRSYLGTIGVHRDSLVIPGAMWVASLDLFDLSDTTRLRSATADGFDAPPMPTDPRPGCRPWAQPSPLDRFF